mmetsp:Transcript_5690/g.21556  ORF Transcript_5690/g.21556 Transcript_5690/m.21556 type:complete len:212 (-) Transcript_5690:196-831(-)
MAYIPLAATAPSTASEFGETSTASGLTVSAGRIPHPCSISFSRAVYFPGGSKRVSPFTNVPRFTPGFRRFTSSNAMPRGSMMSIMDSPRRVGYTRGWLIFAMPPMISVSRALNFPAGSRMVSPTPIASPSFFALHRMISATLIDRFCAIVSRVSPLRRVYGRMLAWPAATGTKGEGRRMFRRPGAKRTAARVGTLSAPRTATRQERDTGVA